jgi:hypothetical protein
MRLRSTLALCTVTLTAAAAMVPVASATAQVPRRSARPLMRASYPARGARIAVPRAFLGISQDWSSLLETIGTPDGDPNPLYHVLVSNLAAYGGGQPTLSLDGVAAWGQAQDPGSSFQTVTNELAASEGITPQQLILGIDMATTRPAVARTEIAAWQSTLPRVVRAYDLTDDIDAYSDACTDESSYTALFERFSASLAGAGETPPLAGGCGYNQASRFLTAAHKLVSLYVQHSYVGSACNVEGQPWPMTSTQRPTIARLLSPGAALATAADNRAAARVSHRYNLPYQFTDWQSYGCGGLAGVTNTFASALWGVDEMFLDASEGVRGIDVHLTSPSYAPFELTSQPNGTLAAQIEPLYYAMLLFAQATGERSQILEGVSNEAHAARGANVRLWATEDQSRTLRFLVIDKDLHRSGWVRIHVRHAIGAATVERLVARRPSTTAPVYLGGQTFGTGPTRTAQLTGHVARHEVKPTNGTYTFHIRRATAALLVVPASSD